MIAKSKLELKYIKKAASIANSCLPLIEKLLKEKITEKELAREIRRKIYSQNAGLAFRTLVASGKRASQIHAKPTNKLIKGLGYIDFGVSYKGYKVDLTVPFVKGKISKREEKILKTTLKAYEIALKSVKLRENCFKVFEKVDNFLRKNGFSMKHSLGHGIGKKVHEKPTIGIPKEKIEKLKKEKLEKLKKQVFEKGMVFTIEPGIYVKSVGGCRIENTFFLSKKLVQLTKAKLIVVS